MNKTQEALKLALEDLQDANGMAYSEFSVENLYGETITAIREALAEESSGTEQPKLSDYELDGMHHNKPHKCKYPKCPYPCPDLPDCRDAEQPAPVAEPHKQQEPVKIEYWLQDTMESGRWVTTDNMARATAEKMLSGEYGDVYPQGRIVEPSPPASKPWVGLTDEEIEARAINFYNHEMYKRAVLWAQEKLKERNQ